MSKEVDPEMVVPVNRDRLFQLARRGAEIRLADLQAEVRQIDQMLKAMNSSSRTRSQQTARASVHRKRAWSAEQRRAAADRMRASWASRRQE